MVLGKNRDPYGKKLLPMIIVDYQLKCHMGAVGVFFVHDSWSSNQSFIDYVFTLEVLAITSFRAKHGAPLVY